MECSCGSPRFTEHKIQKDKKVIAEYMACESCGRVMWLWGKDKVNEPTLGDHIVPTLYVGVKGVHS